MLSLTVLALPGAVSAFTTKTTASGKPIRWTEQAVPMRMGRQVVNLLEPGEARRAAAIATDAWLGLPRVPDVLLQDGLSNDGPGYHQGTSSNGIYLVRPWTFDSQKLAVTVTTYEEATGKMIDADVLVNGDVGYDLLEEHAGEEHAAQHAPRRRSDDYDLAAVLTHELGHVLGLGESEADRLVTMWPYIRHGETHQRSIEADDEQGAITIYRSQVLSEPRGGCGGQASVPGRPTQTGSVWWLVGLLAAAGLVSRIIATPVRRRYARSLALAFSPLLFAGQLGTAPAGDPAAATRKVNLLLQQGKLAELQSAVLSGSAEVRLAAAQALADQPYREYRRLASRLAEDSHPAVSAAGLEALHKTRHAAPRHSVPAAQAGSRLSALLGSGQLLRGRIARLGASREDGLIFTRYEVVDQATGTAHGLRLPGGTLNGISQQVGEEPLPSDGAELVVVPRRNAPAAWAHVSGTTLYGGSLGHGPAIRDAL
ncbi:MAG: matrixin family metalloprotease [Proteobacteria bacterium]|nr:matrixin family metalloprotease [Pseudomonadota bacterium]